MLVLQGLRASAGDLIIFNGQRSLHRVTAVKGAVKRIIAVLSYDTRPAPEQQVGSQSMNISLYGDRVADIYKQRNMRRAKL